MRVRVSASCALNAASRFACLRLSLPLLEQRLLDVGTPVLQREDVGGGLDEAGVEEEVDVLRAEALYVQRAARHEVAQRLDRLAP